jgi:hypothetical protein
MTATLSPRTIVPTAPIYDLLLTATTPLSHHDATVRDDSNRMLFNRQRQFVGGGATGGAALPATAAAALAAAHPIPSDLLDVFDGITVGEFVATALVRLFLDLYNSAEGTGLFAGMERYGRLESRARQAAISAATLRTWWDRLCDGLVVPIHGGDHDAALLRLLTVPIPLQQRTLRLLAREYRSIVAVARLWHQTAKLSSPEYAAAVGRDIAGEAVPVPLAADPDDPGAAIVDVPQVTANSLRHQIVREPSWSHLRDHLGLVDATPGRGPLPQGVEAIFYNGGNIASGAKQPANVFGLSLAVRRAFPSLDLLGGVTDSFDLGESKLRVAAWLVCRENAAALAGSPAADLPTARVSVFDLLDDVTLTRQAGAVGTGQMLWSFETLCPGAAVLCRLGLAPFTPELTRGALFAAVDRYLAEDASLGGQAARGFGRVVGEWLVGPTPTDRAAKEAYETYLEDNRDALLAALRDGSLGSGARILT